MSRSARGGHHDAGGPSAAPGAVPRGSRAEQVGGAFADGAGRRGVVVDTKTPDCSRYLATAEVASANGAPEGLCAYRLTGGPVAA